MTEYPKHEMHRVSPAASSVLQMPSVALFNALLMSACTFETYKDQEAETPTALADLDDPNCTLGLTPTTNAYELAFHGSDFITFQASALKMQFETLSSHNERNLACAAHYSVDEVPVISPGEITNYLRDETVPFVSFEVALPFENLYNTNVVIRCTSDCENNISIAASRCTLDSSSEIEDCLYEPEADVMNKIYNNGFPAYEYPDGYYTPSLSE